MATYQQEMEALAEKRADAESKARNEAGLLQVYKAYPQLTPCVANDKMLDSYCAPDYVSVRTIQFALENGSDLFSELALRELSDAREALANIIASHSGDPAFVKKSLLSKMAASKFPTAAKGGNIFSGLVGADSHSTRRLQQEAEEVSARAALRQMPGAELRSISKTSTDPRLVGQTVANQNAARQAAPPEIPATLTRKKFHGYTRDQKLAAIRKYGDVRLDLHWQRLENRVPAVIPPLMGERQMVATIPYSATNLPATRKEFAGLTVPQQRILLRTASYNGLKGADALNAKFSESEGR